MIWPLATRAACPAPGRRGHPHHSEEQRGSRDHGAAPCAVWNWRTRSVSTDRLREARDPGPHEPPEVCESQLRRERVGTCVEHDLIVLGEEFVGEHRQPEEVAERGHGADLAGWKAVAKLRLLAEP